MIHPKNCGTCIKKCKITVIDANDGREVSFNPQDPIEETLWFTQGINQVGCASYQSGCITEWMCKNGCDQTECHFTIDYDAKVMYPDKCPMCSPGINPKWIRINNNKKESCE